MKTLALILLIPSISACATDGGALPAATAFWKGTEPYPDLEACLAAQTRGEYPAFASCRDELLLCPDHRASLTTGDVVISGSYEVEGAVITATWDEPLAAAILSTVHLHGTLHDDGTLTTNALYSLDDAVSISWMTSSAVADSCN